MEHAQISYRKKTFSHSLLLTGDDRNLYKDETEFKTHIKSHCSVKPQKVTCVDGFCISNSCCFYLNYDLLRVMESIFHIGVASCLSLKSFSFCECIKTPF